MPRTRSLTLRRETLTDLSSNEMAHVAGAGGPESHLCHTLLCFEATYSCVSLEHCPTTPVGACVYTLLFCR